MYTLFFRLVFTRMDPEQAHHLAFRWIRLAARVPVLRTFVAAALAPRHEELRTEALGLRMHGPFGLAAGFDKNAVGDRRPGHARLRPRRDRHRHRRAAARQPAGSGCSAWSPTAR